MKLEELGFCPCCINENNGRGPLVNLYASRKDNGDLQDIYIFGDDDFSVPAKDHFVTEVKISEDNKTVTEVVCPRCKERLAVNIDIVKPENEKTTKHIPLTRVQTTNTQNSNQLQ